jgi:plastocyanin
MSKRMPLVIVVALAIVTMSVFTTSQGLAPVQAVQAQQTEQPWFSTTLWRPTLVETGEALAEIVNQIDATCLVSVDPAVATNGAASEGSVYAFTITWTCPFGAPEQPEVTWLSSMVWRPTLEEAGIAIAEVVNQIDASCTVDVVPAAAASGAAPEGPVYAFAITWACPAAAAGTGTWGSVMLWRPTLEEAGIALAETVNQIGGSCPLDVDPIETANGPGPEGPVYAFVVTWGCAGAPHANGESTPSTAIVARDIAYEPTQLTVPANTDLTLTVTNEGATTHNFSVDSLQFSENILPGTTAQMTLNVPPGTYEFYCNVPGHREAGMAGTITAE